MNEPGGEVDAFIAEISAVIRYRNRTNAPYEPFHVPIREKFFDATTGEVLNRRALSEDILMKGGSLSYLKNYSNVFIQYVRGEVEYLESNAKILEAIPNFLLLSREQEQAKRMRLRANLLRSRFANIF